MQGSMQKKCLVIYIPVIHKGYVDFLKKIQNEIFATYIIADVFVQKLSAFEPDIAALDVVTTKDLLEKIGFNTITILTEGNIKELEGKEIILIEDEISRNLYNTYLKNERVQWESVFLRWDKSKVLVQNNLEDIPTSTEQFDMAMMQAAKKLSEKSGDWWRQVGAVLVKDKEVVLEGYNKNLPSDHTPYQVGGVRDFFVAGERQDLSNTIHAEQSIIAQAAKEGIAIKDLSLYVVTFPCPVCAKLIACSGMQYVYFGEGGSNFDAKKVLEAAGVKIIHVTL